MARSDDIGDRFEALLKARLRGSENRADCPEIATVAAYSARAIAGGERDAVERHLAGCAACRAELAAIARAHESAASREAETSPGIRRWWSSRPAGLAVAGGIGLIVAIGLARDYYHQEAPPPTELAMAERKAAPSADEAPPPEVESAAKVPEAAPMAALQRAERRKQATLPRLPEPLAAPPEVGSAANENAPLTADQLAKSETEQQAGAPAAAALGAGTGAVAGAPLAPGAPPAVPPLAQASGSGAVASSSRLSVGPPPGTLSSTASPPSYAAGGMNSAAPAQAQVPTIAKLWFHKTINSPDGSVRWEFGTGGLIERFVSTGMSAVRVPGVTADLTAGSTPSSSVCWIVGRGGTILRTVDGTNWEKVNSPTSADLTAVDAQGAESAIVTAQDSSRYATSDGGRSWQPQ